MPQNSNQKIELTAEQQEFDKKIRQIYNNGNIHEAYNMAYKAYRKNSKDLYCKYIYSVMCGDYSANASLREGKQKKLLGISRRLLKGIFEDKNLIRYPGQLVSTIKNEYYFFHQLFEEQFNLGKENINKGNMRGFYCMCVGATELAKKYLENKNFEQANAWAANAIEAFVEFEKVDPCWHNINYFAGIAFAITGRYDESLAIYREMFKKQNQPVDDSAFASFKEEVYSIMHVLEGKSGK